MEILELINLKVSGEGMTDDATNKPLLKVKKIL